MSIIMNTNILRYTLVYITLTVLISNSEAACKDDWPDCSGGGVNTVCTRGFCGPEGSCKEFKSDRKFRKLVVDFHNELRNSLAMGNDTRGGNTKSADMMALSYNIDLEYTARCWINKCKFEHDKCRGTKKFPYAGQNLYFSEGHKYEDTDAETKNYIQKWYDEIKDTTAEQIKSFKTGSAMIGHFTALVWSRSTHVGCWRSFTGLKNYVACNYGPGGNMIGEPVYNEGDACTKCPAGVSCNAKYKGLCGEVDESDLDKPARAAKFGCLIFFNFGIFGVLLLLVY